MNRNLFSATILPRSLARSSPFRNVRAAGALDLPHPGKSLAVRRNMAAQ